MGKEITVTERIKSKSASAVPGDSLQELTAPMRDTDGEIHMPGTKFRSLSAGHNNATGRDERTIYIWG